MLTVSVVVTALAPLGVTVAGLKVQEALAGKPEQEKLTCWLNPPLGVMLTVVVAELPCAALPLVGLREMLKSPEGAEDVITRLVALEVEAALLLSPP